MLSKPFIKLFGIIRFRNTETNWIQISKKLYFTCICFSVSEYQILWKLKAIKINHCRERIITIGIESNTVIFFQYFFCMCLNCDYDFFISFLAAIAALWLTMSVCLSVCLSVCRSVCVNEFQRVWNALNVHLIIMFQHYMPYELWM